MRIGIDARLTYYRKAGISRYTMQLIDALSRRDERDEFVVLENFRSRRPVPERAGFSRRRIFTPSHHRLEQFLLPFEVSPLRLDVLHSPDFIPPFRRNCRSVITIHDLVFMLFPHFLSKGAASYYGQIDQAVRNTDAIIAVSEATKKDLMRLLGVPKHKITVIYEAASPMFRPLPRDEAREYVRARFGIDGPFVFFISTIEPRKNIPTLLRAHKRVLDSYGADVKLVLAGERGWLYDEVFALVSELGLVDDVLFLGRVSSEELLWLYNAATLLTAPSIYEGFGLTPLEAMACGTPVVVSNVSSLPEVVSDAGLLVDPEDAEEMSVAIWRLLSDSELGASLSAKGLKRAGFFSWDKAAEETMALYKSLA